MATAAFSQTPLSFSAADPRQCRPLQIWSSVDDNHENMMLMQPAAHNISGGGGASVCSVRTDGLDPDVVEAFQRIMLEQSCPKPFYVPNVPGMLPSHQTANHLVFDEYVLEAMAKRGWARTQGMTMLTPMACALYEHWKNNKGSSAHDAA